MNEIHFHLFTIENEQEGVRVIDSWETTGL